MFNKQWNMTFLQQKLKKRPIHQHPTQLAKIRCTILQVLTLESHYLSQICRREEPLRFNFKLWKFPLPEEMKQAALRKKNSEPF